MNAKTLHRFAVIWSRIQTYANVWDSKGFFGLCSNWCRRCVCLCAWVCLSYKSQWGLQRISLLSPLVFHVFFCYLGWQHWCFICCSHLSDPFHLFFTCLHEAAVTVSTEFTFSGAVGFLPGYLGLWITEEQAKYLYTRLFEEYQSKEVTAQRQTFKIWFFFLI